MAGKRKEGSTKKVVKKAPKKKKDAANGAGAAEAAAEVGHNTRIPSKAEMENYFARLDALHTQKREADARYMSDIKNIYEEAAKKLGSSRKIMRRLYKEKNSAESFRNFIEELEPKERDDLDRLTLGAAKAFGEDTPFGSFLKGQIEFRGTTEEEHDEVQPPESEVVQRAREGVEANERAITQEQKSH